MQIAGSRCSICKEPVILATEGKLCVHCAFAVHLHCEPNSKCSTCGNSFHHFQPQTDPFWNACDPREKHRAPASGLCSPPSLLYWLVSSYFISGHSPDAES